MKHSGRARGVAAAALLPVLCVAWLAGAAAARAEPLRLAYASWVSAGPFFVARAQGWFAEEGVEVELIAIEDLRGRGTALATGAVDAIVAPVDQAVLMAGTDAGLRLVFALSDSRGGDGIVATTDIADLAALKGRRVAVEHGSSRQFFLNALLRPAGLAESDLDTVSLPPGEAGRAFERGEVDAAVTWQPWLDRAAAMEGGHVLADGATAPGLLVEALLARQTLLDGRAAELRALYDAWKRAVDFAREAPDEADRIMADGIGRWLRHADVVEEMRAGIVWYDGAMNEALFGTPAAPGPLADTIRLAAELWSGFGRLQGEVAPRSLVSHDLVAE